MQQVKVSNSMVSFHTQGNGPGLVLVHGTGADWQGNWAHLIERFSAYRKVVCPNYSGSGDTKDDGEPLSLDLLAKQIIAAAEDAGAVPFDIMGLSLGATLTAYIAAKYPEYVNAVILLGGFSSTNDSRSQLEFNLWRDLIKTDRLTMAKLIMLTCFTPRFVAEMSKENLEENINIIVENNNWEGMARQVELNLTIDISDMISSIKKRTLVIACEHDYIVAKERSQELVKLNPDFEYTELSSGHMAVHEKPEELTNIALQFLLRGS
ncbi:alpha/beta fold hydrolase [Serratia sp. (in: enterobacteria)]|uniref:alpha/beta fold hydrolase n=1 Tax=Serratia sp. (in: enterobacteria) TaxID=616 RepID=UPI003988BBE6